MTLVGFQDEEVGLVESVAPAVTVSFWGGSTWTSSGTNFSINTANRTGKWIIFMASRFSEGTTMTFGGQSMTKLEGAVSSFNAISLWISPNDITTTSGSTSVVLGEAASYGTLVGFYIDNLVSTTPVETQVIQGGTTDPSSFDPETLQNGITFVAGRSGGSGAFEFSNNYTSLINSVVDSRRHNIGYSLAAANGPIAGTLTYGSTTARNVISVGLR